MSGLRALLLCATFRDGCRPFLRIVSRWTMPDGAKRTLYSPQCACGWSATAARPGDREATKMAAVRHAMVRA